MSNNFPNTRVPYMAILFDNSRAQGGSSTWKTLIVGHAVEGAAAALEKPYLISDAESAQVLFGEGSLCATQLYYYKENDENTETWVLALPEGSGSVASQATITPTLEEEASVSGTLSLYIAGTLVQVGLTAVDTFEKVSTAIVSAINSTTNLPCTAVLSENKSVLLKAKHKGLFMNEVMVTYNLSSESLPTGLKLECSNFSGGSGVPDLSKVFAAIKDTRFQSFVIPFSDNVNLKILSDELLKRWEPTLQNDGFAFVPLNKTLNNAVTEAESLNSQNISTTNFYGFPNAHFDSNAALAAQCSASASVDPALPLSQLPLSGILAAPLVLQFSFSERTSLLNAGVSTLSIVNNTVYTERLITTYKKTAAGVSDESYLNAETIFTLSKIRETFRNGFWSKFSRFKLADDGTKIAPGQKILTPKSAKAEFISIARELEEEGLIQNVDLFIRNLSVTRDAQNRSKLNALLPPTIMSQLFNVDATLQFRR